MLASAGEIGLCLWCTTVLTAGAVWAPGLHKLSVGNMHMCMLHEDAGTDQYHYPVAACRKCMLCAHKNPDLTILLCWHCRLVPGGNLGALESRLGTFDWSVLLCHPCSCFALSQ